MGKEKIGIRVKPSKGPSIVQSTANAKTILTIVERQKSDQEWRLLSKRSFEPP